MHGRTDVGCHVVGVVPFYPVDPSSSPGPAEVLKRTQINEKEVGDGPLKKMPCMIWGS